jgi:hypothetical protein
VVASTKPNLQSQSSMRTHADLRGIVHCIMTNSRFELIKDVRIRKVANYIARQLPPGSCLDANDLAQKSVLKALRGPHSRAGPMRGGTAGLELNERSCSYSPETRLAARIYVASLITRGKLWSCTRWPE